MIRKISQLVAWVAVLVLIPALVLAAPIGRISHIEGEADITRAGAKAFPIKVNDPVNAGDILRTKAKTKVEVTFNDGNTLWLAEKTYLKITQYQNVEGKKSFFDLFRGKTRAVVNTLARRSSLELRTPTAVSGVRGTIIIGYFTNGLSGFAFERGQGYGFNRRTPDRVVTIRTGEVMQVATPTAQPVVRTATANEIEQHLTDTSATQAQGEGPAQEEPQGEGTQGQGEGQGQDQGQQGQDQGQQGQDQGEGQGEDQGTQDQGTQDQGSTPDQGTTPGGTDGSGQPSGDGNIPDTSTLPPPADTPPPPPPPPPTQTTVIETPPPSLPTGPTETFTTLTQAVTLGALTGTMTASISDTTNTGTLKLSGTGATTSGTEAISGALSDGSTYDAYLAGIPGSWRGLFTGISNKGGALSLLKGSLDGTYIPPNGADGSVTASGSIVRQSGYSSLEPTMGIGTLSGLYLPVINSVSFGEGLGFYYESGAVSGYQTTTGGLLGIWGVQTAGSYFNSPEIGSWPIQIGSSNGYAYFLGGITVTDDLNGHVSISGDDSLLYMDQYYYGLMSLNYRGVYSGSSYQSVGTGAYKLAPLKYSGQWGIGGTLFSNSEGTMAPTGSDSALIGGLTQAPWSGKTDFKAIGDYSSDSSGAAYTLWNTQLAGSDTASGDGYFEGGTAGIWGSNRPGSIRAIFITPGVYNATTETYSSTAGILKSDDIAVTPYADLTMWKAEGTLGPYSSAAYPVTYTGDPANWTLGYGSTDDLILRGSFAKNISSSTTAYGSFGTLYLADLPVNTGAPTSPPWGIYNFILTGYNEFYEKPDGIGNVAWAADLGGSGQFGYGGSNGYWLASISADTGLWTGGGEIAGTVSGEYVTYTHWGSLSGPFYGLYNTAAGSPYTYDGVNYSDGTWIGQSIGIYEGTSTDFGGSWYNCFLYDDSGYMGWDSGDGEGVFGFKKRTTDSNYDFKAIGYFTDDFYDAAQYRGTYLWSGPINHFDSTDRYLEAFTAGLRTKADPGAATGVMSGYGAAVYYTPTGAGLISGALSGNFYETNFYVDYNQMEGLWKVASGTDGMTHTDKTASLPDDFNTDPILTPLTSIDSGWFHASAAGSFDGEATILGGGYEYNGHTQFVTYADAEAAKQSLPFGIYNLKIGYDDSLGTQFWDKPAGTSVPWTAQIGGSGEFGYSDNNSGYVWGYWLADIDGGAWTEYGERAGHGTISGDLHGKYLTSTHLGNIAGPFYGLYTEADQYTYDDINYYSSGTWVGVSVGTYEADENAPLAFGGMWNERYAYGDNLNSLYYNGSGFASWAGEEWGLVGLTQGPYDGTKNFIAMGEFDLPNSGYSRYLWNSPISAPFVLDKVEFSEPLTGGDFLGYTNGIWREDTGSLTGAAVALYVSQDGTSAGLWRSYDIDDDANSETYYTVVSSPTSPALSLSGANYPGIGMWEISGKMNLIEKETVLSREESLNERLIVGLVPYQIGMMGEFEDVGTVEGYAVSKVLFLYDTVEGRSLPWGIYDHDMSEMFGPAQNGGFFSIAEGITAEVFSDRPIRVGGQGFGSYGYWLGNLTADWMDDQPDADDNITGGEIRGTLAGAYLTRSQMGRFSGPFAGIYDYEGCEGDCYGTWIGSSVGTWEGEPLAFGGETNGSLMYYGYGGSTTLSVDGSASGLLGGTGTTLLSGSNTKALMMGSYGSGGDSQPYLMYGSGWYFDGATVYGGAESGSFSGYMVGLWAGGKIKARMLSLYSTYTEEEGYTAGYLESVDAEDDNVDEKFNLAGSYYPVVGMWEIPDGTLRAIAKDDTSPGGFASNYFDGNKGLGTFSTGGTLTVTTAAGDPIRFSALDWGIWNAGFGGTYSGTTSADWAVNTGGVFRNTTGDGYGGYTETGYWLGTISGAAWGEAEIDGTYDGEALTNLAHYALTGDVIGSPVGVNWQAAGIGTYTREDLVLNGTWGGGPACLFANDGGHGLWVGYDTGRIGVTEDLTVYALGTFHENWRLVGESYVGGGSHLWNSPLSGGDVDTGHTLTDFSGFTGGAWKNGLLKGNALAIYRNFMTGDAGFLYTATSAAAPFGLTGDYFNTYVYAGTTNGYGGFEEGMWSATGALASVSMPVPEGFDAFSYDLASDGQMAKARLAGKFDDSGYPSPISGSGGLNSGSLTFLRSTYSPYDTLPWGVYNLRLYGDEVAANTFSEKPAGTSDWSALAGGEITYPGYGGYGGFNGRWIATVRGSWTADGEISGTVGAVAGDAGTFGRFLTDNVYGTLGGPFTGVNSYSFGTSGTWIGQSIGTYQGQQKLAFSSPLIDGSLYQVVPGTVVGAEYLNPHYESSGGPNPWFEPLSYEIDYFVPDGGTYDAARMIAYEDVEVAGDGYGYDDEYQYLPFGKWLLVRKGMGVTHPEGAGLTPTGLDWSVPSTWPHFTGTVVTNPAVPFPGSGGNYVKAIDWNWETNALVRGGAFTGLLGGLPGQSLWSSDSGHRTGLVLMGSHDAYAGSQLFGSMMSYDGSVDENGAYIGALTGIIQDANPVDASGENHLEGLIVGIYVDPDGNAGILKGDVTGTSYQGINMWEAPEGSATLYRHAANLASGLSASALAENLFVGYLGAGINSGIHGTFAGGAGSFDSPMGILGLTLSLQPDWGIFSLQIGMDNTYTNTGATAWTGTLFGSGVFGQYGTTVPYADLGYWFAKFPSGTWNGGKLTGDFGGGIFFTDSAFVTHKKVGTLEGSLLGTYDGGTSGAWQAASTGTYVKTKDVLFSSEIWGNSYNLAQQTSGALSYADGSVYNYWYTSSEGYGNSIYYNKTANTETITRMDTEGPPGAEAGRKEVWVHNLTDNTWTYATPAYGSLADLANAPAGGDWMFGPATQWGFQDFDFNGILAGVDNLWANMGTTTPTHVYLMGDIDTFDGDALKLFSGTAVSFDPLVSLNPDDYWWDSTLNGGYGGYAGGSRSPIGGAYYGFLGGTVNSAKALSGIFRALYMDENRNVGLVFTDTALAGSFDSTVGMWKAEGDVYTYPLFPAALIGPNVDPATFAGQLNHWEDRMSLSVPIWEDGHVSGEGVALSASAETGISLPILAAYPAFVSLNSTLVGGILSGSAPPTSWTWTVPPGGPIYNPETHMYNPVRTNFIGVNIASDPANNTFTGSMVTASVEWANAMTALSGGQIKGMFDPNATWQAVISATGMDTATFISKATALALETEAQRTAFYKATGIPCFQVGSTDLRGNGDVPVSGGAINLGSAVDASRGILNATFFAPSTGAKPQVWASGLVNGSYTGSPTGGIVALSGYAPGSTGQAANGINATFNVLPFGTTNWGATITGHAPAGSLSGAQGFTQTNGVTFQGGAAGQITKTPDATPGMFTGTAAGVVH